MSKARIYEVAKEFNVTSKEIIDKLKNAGLGNDIKNHMSNLTDEEHKVLNDLYKKTETKTKVEVKQEVKPEAKKEVKPEVKPVEQKQATKPSQTKPVEQKKEVRATSTAFNKPNEKKPNNTQKPQTNQQNKQQRPGPKKAAPIAPITHKAPVFSEPIKSKKKNTKKRGRQLEEEIIEEIVEETIEEEGILIVKLPKSITVKDLAEKLRISSAEIIKDLMKRGIMANLNQEIDFYSANAIAELHDAIVEEMDEIDLLEVAFEETEDDEKDLVERPPVVVVMGHVDHGKTSLLDKIRSSKVTVGEAGGITQHIGAYTVQVEGNPITFLDTPGHEAFTAMRMRGAQVTDIAILVVAADDGVMPQTVEAINHAKAAQIEIIVAVNKIDKESANLDRVKQELVEHGLLSEDWGGTTIFVPVSAITGEGIDTLLEMIVLTSEMKELKANPNKQARGTVIEACLDKGKGPVATVLVKSGTLKVGDPIVAGPIFGKIRAMTDHTGAKVKFAGPSTPVEIQGLAEVPAAGDMIYVANNERHARQVAETVVAQGRVTMTNNSVQKVSLDDLFSQIQAGNVKDLNIIIKADVQGSVEAVRNSLERLSNEEVRIRSIHGGVGAINESDVMLASASNAIIIGFNVKAEVAAKIVADNEKVDIRLYRIIYNAIQDIETAMKGMLEPIFAEKVIGHAEIRQTFKASGVGTIAGSYILDGYFTRSSKVRVTREGKLIFEGGLDTLKRFKDDVKEVKAGYECGLLFTKFNDVKEGDLVEAYIMEEVPR